MAQIPFCLVNNRKRHLQTTNKNQKISFKTVSKNLNCKNLLLFIESGDNDMDYHIRTSFSLYKRLLTESEISDPNKRLLENALHSTLSKVKDIENIRESISSLDIDSPLFFARLNILENCDRVLRNETKLAKRFDFNKTIQQNILRGHKHTVYELCSLIDTYDISSKAKMNIAFENVLYALYKSGYANTEDLKEATEYITEYFLTRDAVITDKQYKGYIDVLEHNQFIDKDNPNLAYIFEAIKIEGNSFADKAKKLVIQCETKQCSAHISQILKIKNEKQASAYIDKSIEMILNEEVTINDSLLLLKSIYCLSLIGNISKAFVDYKLEMSKQKVKIRQKLSTVQNQQIIRDVLSEGSILQFAEFVSESVYFENYILDNGYKEETDIVKIMESQDNSNQIKDIINSFKASNEKSTSKFKNMISRIMTKSPDNIINETPNLFGAVKIMLYIGVAASSTLGPVFAAVLALVNKLISTHLDLKQAEKLLKHLRSEKEKAEKKLDKLSGKEKDAHKEYIDCLDQCIKKVSNFISNIDDENEELNAGSDDDDFGFDDLDFGFESTVLESGKLYNNSVTKEILDLLSQSNIEILTCIAPLFDNCTETIANEFYNFVDSEMKKSKSEIDRKVYSNILEHRGLEKITQEESFVVEVEAVHSLKEILTEAKKVEQKKDKFNLNTLKMAVINFKKKFRDLKGKEQELWKNIDIATVYITKGIQQALTSDRREAIIKGSIIPSFSKCIKSAIAVGAVGAFTGPVGAVITAVGMLGASKILNERERKLLYDEIDTELQVVEKQIQLAENEGDMNQYRFLLNYQKKLTREKHRIKYGVHMSGRTIPEVRRGND